MEKNHQELWKDYWCQNPNLVLLTSSVWDKAQLLVFQSDFSTEARVENHSTLQSPPDAFNKTSLYPCTLPPFLLLSNVRLSFLALYIPNSWQMGFIDCLAYGEGYCTAQKAGSKSAFYICTACFQLPEKFCSSYQPVIQTMPFAPGSMILIMEMARLKN